MTALRRTTRTIAMPESVGPLVTLAPEEAGIRLARFIGRHPRLFVLTGAGVSTDSGIPDYRDQQGAWKRRQPVQHQDFMSRYDVRQRYWGRSLVGWPMIRNARPNDAHFRISELEQRQHTTLLVTQNVDRLHQQAGSRAVVDLHGRLDEVRCMACHYRTSRDQVHHHSAELNPDFLELTATAAPDGDADLEVSFDHFRVVDCPECGGILKPDVVFFGDFVPKERVVSAHEALAASDGLLVIGSSLMVYSGLRFCRYAKELGKPLATLNLGRTRADNLMDLQLHADITESLNVCLSALTPGSFS